MEESLHQPIGVADFILRNKNRRGGLVALGSATLLWFLSEKCGYSFFPFVVDIQLLVVVMLFLWAKSAILFNRPMPELPNLEITEASVLTLAHNLRLWINSLLSVGHQIYVARNANQLFQVSLVLWTVSFLANCFNFLTLLFLGVVLTLLYERYQDHIDDKLALTHQIIQTHFRKMDQRLLHKIISKPVKKVKKMQ